MDPLDFHSLIAFIIFEVFDWNKNDEPDFYGEVQTSIADMAQNKGSLSLKNDKKKKKGKNMGQVLVRRCDIEKRHTFMEVS